MYDLACNKFPPGFAGDDRTNMKESSREIEDRQDTEWESLYTCNVNPYFGYCDTVEEADDLIQEYSYRTSTSFTTVRSTKGFGSFNLTGSSSTHSVHFRR